jgi:hypothetical protein
MRIVGIFKSTKVNGACVVLKIAYEDSSIVDEDNGLKFHCQQYTRVLLHAGRLLRRIESTRTPRHPCSHASFGWNDGGWS